MLKLPLTSEPFGALSVTNKVQGKWNLVQLRTVSNLRDISVATVIGFARIAFTHALASKEVGVQMKL